MANVNRSIGKVNFLQNSILSGTNHALVDFQGEILLSTLQTSYIMSLCTPQWMCKYHLAIATTSYLNSKPHTSVVYTTYVHNNFLYQLTTIVHAYFLLQQY